MGVRTRPSAANPLLLCPCRVDGFRMGPCRWMDLPGEVERASEQEPGRARTTNLALGQWSSGHKVTRGLAVSWLGPSKETRPPRPPACSQLQPRAQEGSRK